MRFQILPDGDELVGRSYDEIVRAMADAKLGTVHNLFAYRKKTAERVMALNVEVARIDPSSNRSFVNDLVSAGFLKKLS